MARTSKWLAKLQQGLKERMSRGVSELKEFGVTATSDYGWNTLSGRMHTTYYPGSDVDWESEAGVLWYNPAISLCTTYLFNKIVEPQLQVLTRDKQNKPVPVLDHPMLQLLQKPNPEYSGSALRRAMALSYKTRGNAYAVIVRDAGGFGKPRELWYIPHWQMVPLAPKDGGPTEFYAHTVKGKTKFYAARDVIHLKFGIDPEKPREGFNPFQAHLRGVVSDGEIDTYTATILRNMGVIGAVVSPLDGRDNIKPEQAKQLKMMFAQQTGGDMRAGVVVPSLPVKVDKVGNTPQDLALDKIGDRPESRIVAAFGFEAMAIGLPSGNTTYANKAEARAASIENGIIPMLTDWAEILTTELLDEMGKPGEWAAYNYDAVRDLMPDQNAMQRRIRDNWKAGYWTLNECRVASGQPKDDERDGYSWELMSAPVAAATAAGSDGIGGNGS